MFWVQSVSRDDAPEHGVARLPGDALEVTVAGIGQLAQQVDDLLAPSHEVTGSELGAGYVLEGSVRWERSPGRPGRVRRAPAARAW